MDLSISQMQAVNKLSALKAGALFMEMGTGKTRTAIELIKLKQNDINLVVWIAPSCLIHEKSYKDEINKWYKEIDIPIKYYTIEGVSASDTLYMNMLDTIKDKKVFCVLDESLSIKNAEAARTKRLLLNWDKFAFRIILNGTPLSKGLIDMYSQIQFIHPNILNMTENQFAKSFLVYRKEGYRPWQRWSRPENEDALVEIIRPYIFDSELDLNYGLTNHNKFFNLTYNQKIEYKNYKEDMLDKGEFFNNNIDFLALATLFQKHYTVISQKYDHLNDFILNNPGKKIIVYVKFLIEIDNLKERFDIAEYSGRKKELDAFKKNKNIMVSTYGSGSLGLNLQFCNTIIFFSQTFNYKDKIQAIHRIYRMGQKKDCEVYNYFVKTGLEKIIWRSLAKKQNTLDNVKKHISKEEALKL